MISFPSRERGFVAGALLLLLVAVLVVVFAAYFVFGRAVPPNAIGIRRNLIGVPGLLHEGFDTTGLRPGLHWEVPFFSAVQLIPRDMQFVSFHSDTAANDAEAGELIVQTTDGAQVKMDVSLIFRFYDAPAQGEALAPDHPTAVPAEGIEAKVPIAVPLQVAHGGPADLLRNFGSDHDNTVTKFSQIAGNKLRRELNKLSAVDFYNPEKRETAVLRAHRELVNEVAPLGIEVYATLVRRYTFQDENIENQIFAKNLQDQNERLNAAASVLAEAQARTEKTRAFWDAKTKSLEVEGQAKMNVLESEGRRYEATKQAEGDLLVAKARADIDAARAAALGEMAGSDVYLARELAPLLRSLQGGIITDLDPYDINRWVERLMGGAK